MLVKRVCRLCKLPTSLLLYVYDVHHAMQYKYQIYWPCWVVVALFHETIRLWPSEAVIFIMLRSTTLYLHIHAV